MTYIVEYTGRFRRAVENQVAWLIEEEASISRIDRWFGELYAAIDSLEHWPRRYPVDPGYSRQVGQEVRKMRFGDDLVFYEIDEQTRLVRILSFSHGARSRPD